MSKIPCEMIQDLLPLYVDRLTSETTDREVQEHLETCEACGKLYETMTGEPKITGSLNELPEIEYFKQVKRKNRRKVIGAALGVLGLLAVLLLGRYFVIGVPVGECYATVTAQGDEWLVEGSILDSALVFSRYRIEEENGEKKLVIYGRLPSFVGGDASFSIILPHYEQTLVVNGMRILPDDTVIDKQTKQLFDAKNPYIGDMSANGKLAIILGIGEKLGNFKNSLQTTEEPYGWTLEFEDEWEAADEEWKNLKMYDFACILLALIDNCSEIHWTYERDGETCTMSVDTSTAEEFLEKPVKSYGETLESLQELMQKLGM